MRGMAGRGRISTSGAAFGLRAAQRSRLAAPPPLERDDGRHETRLKTNARLRDAPAASCYSAVLGCGDAIVVAGCGAAARARFLGADARTARHGRRIPHPGAVSGAVAKTRATVADARCAPRWHVSASWCGNSAAARTRAPVADARGARHGGVFRFLLRQQRLTPEHMLWAQTRAVRATVAYVRILVRQVLLAEMWHTGADARSARYGRALPDMGVSGCGQPNDRA